MQTVSSSSSYPNPNSNPNPNPNPNSHSVLSAVTLQRKQRLEAISHKRVCNLDYLKKVHAGDCFWLNVVLLSKADIAKYVEIGVPTERAVLFYSLALSIYRIFDLHTVGLGLGPLDVIRAFSQLLEEWEYYQAGPAMQGMKFVMAKNSSCSYPQIQPIENVNMGAILSDMQRPSVYRHNNAVVYEYLLLPQVAFQLDYVEVLGSLCEALSRLYHYLMKEEECYINNAVYETVLRLDARFKHHVINLCAKEISMVCAERIKEESYS